MNILFYNPSYALATSFMAQFAKAHILNFLFIVKAMQWVFQFTLWYVIVFTQVIWLYLLP
jgi:hypothetical protein